MFHRVLSDAAALIAAFAIFAPTSVNARDAANLAESHAAEHGYARHTLGLFVGAAHEEFGRRDNGLVLGIEYEYRFGPRFGVGAILEHTYGNLDTWVYALPFAYHNGPWKLYAAPGIEETEESSERMLRLGLEYGFHAEKWEISPQLDVDFIEREGEVFVIGLTFARGFGR
jgi:hypothetical protein